MWEDLDQKDRSVCMVVKQQLFEWLTTHAGRIGMRKGTFALGLLKDGIRSRMTVNEIVKDLDTPLTQLRDKYITELMEERGM